ncbi:hypothetical protein FB558_0051 [Pseudonocardia kunmingensis]|uniref:Uncharacterized protein n=1 Tax=Pseudonocardia kunmingensis TaxID=630975 RepID=A0A543DVI3_9PSEU|nr:hypothetical protein FB558_0051 [Pseudonocardia kunmingensis]
MTLSAAQERTVGRLGSARTVPVLRASDAEAGHAAALLPVAAGLDVLELSATVPSRPVLVAAVKAAGVAARQSLPDSRVRKTSRQTTGPHLASRRWADAGLATSATGEGEAG